MSHLTGDMKLRTKRQAVIVTAVTVMADGYSCMTDSDHLEASARPRSA